MTLAQLREAVRSESDTQGDSHISDDDLLAYINGSYFELYDLLATSFGEDYFTSRAVISVGGGVEFYPLPDGTLYENAPAYYKGLLVEGSLDGGLNWITLHRFNLGEKNRYSMIQQALVTSQQYPRYRVQGSEIMFLPKVSGALKVRLWYVPKLDPLFDDGDLADDLSGWLEYVVVDAAIKVLGKQERDANLLAARKAGLKQRIEASAPKRDLGEPNTVTETGESAGAYPGGPFGAFPFP
jgi:hypothetical protein